jgi:hypothetical protein
VLAAATAGIPSAGRLDGDFEDPAALLEEILGLKLDSGGTLARVRSPFPGFCAERLMAGEGKISEKRLLHINTTTLQNCGPEPPNAHEHAVGIAGTNHSYRAKLD